VATLADATQIDLVLSRTSDDGGTAGGVAFRYKLYANEGSDGTAFHVITAYDGSSLAYSVLVGADIGSSGLQFTAGRIYTFKYTAQNEVGESEARYLAPTLRVAMGGAPSIPTQPIVDTTASNETSIKLDWSLPSTTDDLEVERYILWSNLAIPGSSHVILNTTALSVPAFTHAGLQPGSLYSYWLQVENFNGLSADLSQTSASQVTRYACSPPSVFSSLTVLAQTASSVKLGWLEPGASAGCAISQYEILVDDGLLGALTSTVTALPATQFEAIISSPATTTLVVGRQYRF
jgi:hypothetical protein